MNNKKLSLRELLEQQFDRYGITDETHDTEAVSLSETDVPVAVSEAVTVATDTGKKPAVCPPPEWLDTLCQQHSHRWHANGCQNAEEWLTQLAKVDEVLEAHPHETINLLSRIYGICPMHSSAPTGKTGVPLVDEVAAFLRTRQKAKAYVAIDRLIEKAVCPDGTCKYPHYPSVRGEMFRLLNCGAAHSIADAYNQAIWLTDAVRQQLIREQAAALLSERAADAEQSKTAGFCATGKPCGTVDEKPSIRTLLEQAFNKAGIYE